MSIDRTLRLLDAGEREAAFAEARTGYLDCFEAVEAPLDVVAGTDFRFEVEDVFAAGARPDRERRAHRRDPRPHRDAARADRRDASGKLTTEGLGAPLLAFGQSFTLLLREGLEAVLLLSVLLAYLESSEQRRTASGRSSTASGSRILATVVTFFAVDAHLLGAAVRPRGARGDRRRCSRW